MFMSAMEATVIATAMPTVVADLRGVELYGWVGAIYMLATTVTIPIWGKLADVWGRKPVMFVGLALFLAGSAGSGLSTSMPMLIAMRGLQGLGAGALQPLPLTIIGDIYTVEERGRIQGLFGAVWGMSALAGPLIGGLIVSVLSWRWVFFINLPMGVLVALILLAFYDEGERSTAARPPLDGTGALLLAGATILVLVGAGGTAWLVTLPAALVLTFVFVFVERRAADPILPLRLVLSPVIGVASLASTFMGAVMMALVMYLPLFAQGVLGASPTSAGSLVAPLLIGWPLASAISGRLLGRVGYRTLVRLGLGLVAAGSAAVYASLHASEWSLRATTFVTGAGMGLANTALLIAAQASVPQHERGVATASLVFGRSLGGALAVGGLGALFGAALAGKLPEHALDELLGPGNEAHLGAGLAAYGPIVEAAIHPVFAVTVALGVLTAIVGMFFPDVTSRAGGGAPDVTKEDIHEATSHAA